MNATVEVLEEAVLRAMAAKDRLGLELLLADDFVITTAGWLRAPANRAEWLTGIDGHSLQDYRIDSVELRRLGNVTVALVLSHQSGELAGRVFDHDFRYTDVWVTDEAGTTRLAVRHASLVQAPAD